MTSRLRQLTKFFALALLVLAACLDPLYEDGAPLTSGQVICCEQSVLTTCYCPDPSKCLQRPFPCAGGTCSLTPVCPSTAQDAGSVGGGGGSSAGGGGGVVGGGSGTGGGNTGGGAGGGSGVDAGTLDGGSQDGGTADAGTVDAGGGGGAGGGTGGGATGGGTGGGAGGSATGGGGGGSVTGYEFCCVESRLTTCACPVTGCLNAPFTPCPGGACVAGTTTSLCR